MTLPASTPPLPKILTHSIAALEIAQASKKQEPPKPRCTSLLRRRGHFKQCGAPGTTIANLTRCPPCRKRETVELGRPHHVPVAVMLSRRLTAKIDRARKEFRRLGMERAQIASVLQAAIADEEKGRQGK